MKKYIVYAVDAMSGGPANHSDGGTFGTPDEAQQFMAQRDLPPGLDWQCTVQEWGHANAPCNAMRHPAAADWAIAQDGGQVVVLDRSSADRMKYMHSRPATEWEVQWYNERCPHETEPKYGDWNWGEEGPEGGWQFH